MRRRDLPLMLTAVLMAAQAVRAQQKAMPVVGALYAGSPPANPGDLLRGPIHQGMDEMGFVEGQNMMWEYRWAEGHYDWLPALAADLVSRKVDVILALSGTPTALAAKNATSTIPIVFTGVSDPVAIGFVASLARPGGNLTGFNDLNVDLIPKRVELLCELVPQAAAIALLVNPNNEMSEFLVRAGEEATHAKGVRLVVLRARSEDEIEAAFAQLHADALLVGSDAFFNARPDQLAALAARHAVPALYWFPQFVAAGGLISYGTDTAALFRQAGILRGKDTPRRQACRSAGPAADDLQAARQSQDRQGARPHHPAVDPRPRRRGHRMIHPTQPRRRSTGPSARWVGNVRNNDPSLIEPVST